MPPCIMTVDDRADGSQVEPVVERYELGILVRVRTYRSALLERTGEVRMLPFRSQTAKVQLDALREIEVRRIAA